MFTANDSGKHNVCFKAKGDNLEMSDLFQIILSKRKGNEFYFISKTDTSNFDWGFQYIIVFDRTLIRL